MSDTEITFRAAICDALDAALAADPSVLVLGEDVAAAGGVWKTTPGLLERHGPQRVIDTPISELALAGAAFGSAVCGKRPVVEIMFGDFLGLIMDSLVNQAAKWSFLSGGRVRVPLVVRSAVGAGGQFGAVHSQMPIAWFLGIPGLKIVCPSTPADAGALLAAAILDDDPVLFLEHKRLYATRGPAADSDAELGRARILRAGSDVTLISVMRGVEECLAAARTLAEQGCQAEVIDLRTIRPLDRAAVVGSAVRTGRVLVVEEGPRTGGWAAEVVATLVDEALDQLETIGRLTCPDLPIPYSPPLEAAYLPGADAIVEEVLAL